MRKDTIFVTANKTDLYNKAKMLSKTNSKLELAKYFYEQYKYLGGKKVIKKLEEC